MMIPDASTSRKLWMSTVVLALLALAAPLGATPADPGPGEASGAPADVTIPRLPAGATISLDGNTGDWPSEFLDIPITALPDDPEAITGSGRMVIQRPTGGDPGGIYVFFSVTDASQTIPGDRLVLMFGRSDGPHATRGVRFNRSGTADLVHGSLTGPSDLEVDASVPLSISSLSGEWIIEAFIRPSDLGLNNFEAVMPAALLATDEATNSRGRWPSTATPDVSTWLTLATRYPIDFALSMDFSGSMNATDGEAQTRWVRAKRAADLFVATLGLFRDDDFDDRVSLSQYAWTCGNESSGADLTGALQGISFGVTPQSIPAPPTGTSSFTSGNTTDPLGNNCTPIRRGLEFAIDNQLGFPGSDELRDRMVLLLSDGFHNMPDAHEPFIPGTDFDGNRQAFADALTVAMGTDGTAGTDLLSDISTAFGGGETASYSMASEFSQLLTTYVESVTGPFNLNSVPLTGNDYLVGSPRKLVVLGVWNDPEQASNLRVQRGSDDPIEGALFNQEIGYAAVVVDEPPLDGSWRILSAADGVLPDNEFVLVNLRVHARFAVEQRDYGTGEPITLRVALTDDGRPITGADVRVETVRPGEALGNYLSTVQEDCSLGRPEIPRDPIIIDAAPTGAVTRRGRVNGAGDPPPARYALARHHFQRCQKQGLDRDDLPGIPLRDDGAGGDEAAGDGVYTLVFDDTDLEGTYTFRFNVVGTADDGTEFARTRTLSQFVQVEPDAEATPFQILTGDAADGVQTSTYWFLPMDALDNYLGPGFADHFTVDVIGGEQVGEIRDAGNGYYAVEVRHPEDSRLPGVEIDLPGRDFAATYGERRPSPAREVELFGSYTDFDQVLGLDPSLGFGFRIGLPIVGPLNAEVELGAALPDGDEEENGIEDHRFVQVLVGLRLDLPLSTRLVPSASAGVGILGFTNGDSEVTHMYHGSGAVTWYPTAPFGIRALGRVYRTGELWNEGPTTGMQFTIGLVFHP